MKPSHLAGLLAARGTPWPAPVEHFETTGSTNDDLKERARAGAPEWSVVMADRQTAGHGRQGRPWLSPVGNLYLSVLVRPSLRMEDALLLPMVAALAVAEGLQTLDVATRLKWPNDVMADGRKLGGILVESSGTGTLDWAVIGVGLNVGLDLGTVPSELHGSVTSLQAQGSRSSVLEAAGAVLLRMAPWYDALRRGEASDIVGAWRERSLDWWGRPVEARSGDVLVTGIARGLDAAGGLIIEPAAGPLVTLRSAEVREVRPARREG